MSDTSAKSRRSGRKERLAQRAAPPAVNPAPAGQVGGQYRPLSGRDLKDIYDTALRLLRDLGMGEVPTRLHNDLIAAGAVALDNGRVSFPNALVEDAIASAAKTFVLHGRDPDRSIEVGGDRVYFGTGARRLTRWIWTAGFTALQPSSTYITSQGFRTHSTTWPGLPDVALQPTFQTFSIWT